MNTASQGAGPGTGRIDQVKVAVAVLLVVAGVVGSFYLTGYATFWRFLSVLGGLVLGGLVAGFSEPGRRFFAYARESYTETKKVVWPTWKESRNTAAAVFAFVIIMAIFLWVTDKSLEYLLYDLVLGWKK